MYNKAKSGGIGMDFFNRVNEELDKVCGELANIGSELAKVTKDATENVGFHTQVMSEEAKIKEQYRVIGEMFYKECEGDSERIDLLSDAYREAFERISISKWKIENAKEAIARNKGAVCCPECGANVDRAAVFCSKCGKKLKEI